MNLDPKYITLAVFVSILLGLFQERIGAEVLMLCGLLVLVATNVVSIEQALAGFANPALFTIAALFVVGAGLQATGAMETLSAVLLGRAQQKTRLLRMIAPVAALSGFMANTPLVAFMLPIFVQRAKKMRISPSKLLLPLSYATILGGTCTLMGTSTNLVTDAQLRAMGMPGLGLFELAWVGVPVAIVGLLYLATIGQRWLPNRLDMLEYVEQHRREYTVELIVRPGCALAGKTIRESGLRDFPGLYLYAIERAGQRLSSVSPQEKISVHDVLCFSGIVANVVDLQKIRGLEPADHQSAVAATEEAKTPASESLNSLEGVPTAAPRSGRVLCEAVISAMSPLVGRSVRDADFRTHYGASIIAVHRSGEKLSQKIGQIVLDAGDTLLIDSAEDFARRWRNSPDFILVSGLDDSAPVEHRRAILALAIFAVVIGGFLLLKETYIPVVGLVGAVAMILSGCVSGRQAHRSIELPVIVLIGAAMGVGKAMDSSGSAKVVADLLLHWTQSLGPIAVLAALVVLTGLLTEMLSNNATAALMGQIAVALSHEMDLDSPRPYLIAVVLASSYGFATPIGYQTNLMVLNPGGYKFKDYLKVGVPLDLICWTLTIVGVALFWLK